MKTATLTLFPLTLDRASAPEAIGSNAARILENLELDTAGRLKRRGGLARVSVTSVTLPILACGYFTRRDAIGLMIDFQTDGTLRLTQGPTVGWGDVTEFGGSRTAAQWYENFNEDGP